MSIYKLIVNFATVHALLCLDISHISIVMKGSVTSYMHDKKVYLLSVLCGLCPEQFVGESLKACGLIYFLTLLI